MADVSTGDRIAEAALRLFSTRGGAWPSTEEIRREAGVSNGSMYHHYASRADLVARLMNDGMAASQLSILDTLGDDAQSSIGNAVRAQLTWAEQHADLARLIYGDLPDDVLLAAEPRFSRQSRRYVNVCDDWLHHQAERGLLIRRSFAVTHALWLGPTQELARHWLHGHSAVRPTEAADDLAEGAWLALKTR
jgi:AcrR family transcriptional regulator